MKYELLLQSLEPGAPYSSAAVDASLSRRGVTADAQGGRSWRLSHGEVEVRALNQDGAPLATELRVPLAGKTELVRELLHEALQVAEEAGVRLFDPQLMKSLTLADEGQVSELFLRTSKYAGEFIGVSEALDASFPDLERSHTPLWVLAGVGAFLLVVYLLAESLVRG